MDQDGWVPTAEIAAFNRVRALLGPTVGNAALLVLKALEGSPAVEAAHAPVPCLRARQAPQQWVLPPRGPGEEGGQ